MSFAASVLVLASEHSFLARNAGALAVLACVLSLARRSALAHRRASGNEARELKRHARASEHDACSLATRA